MIFGWLEHGTTDRWVMIDAVFPWPALHNGRNALRIWADFENRARIVKQTPGPRRCPWPCKCPVKEDGNAELRVWPVGVWGVPREWVPGDKVWRQPLAELTDLVAMDIGCDTDLIWLGGSTIEKATSSPGLQGRGFLCWGKGEHAPTARDIQRLKDTPLTVGTVGQDIRIMPQGEDAWH